MPRGVSTPWRLVTVPIAPIGQPFPNSTLLQVTADAHRLAVNAGAALDHALVGWIHGGSEGGQNICIVLTDTEGNILPSNKGVRLATAAHVQGGEITAGRWQFFVIPVSELKPGYKDTTRIAFYNPSKETMPTFYLDDVGFTSQKVPLFSGSGAVAEGGEQPPRVQRDAHAIYTDSLKNGWENWSWNSSIELNNKDNPGQGKQAILVEQKPEGGLAFGRHDAFQAAGYSIAANQWQRVSIPLNDFRVGQSPVSKIAITNVGAAVTTYYVDAVSLIK